MDKLQLLAPRKVKTPDILEDISKFLGEEAKNRYSQLQEPSQKTIAVLVERLEFIHHLTSFAEFVKKEKKLLLGKAKITKIDDDKVKVEIPEEFTLLGQDLAGIA